MQRYPGSIAPCDHNVQTSQTDGQTDRQTDTGIIAEARNVYITSPAKNQYMTLNEKKHENS